ncbi:hypothetical protein G6F57_018902 [Rhizopus arrhizus]|nr:hypothetical protein G6F57_018902 [Rhizopus arrhizus]
MGGLGALCGFGEGGIGVHVLLEGVDADAVHHVDEAFDLAVAQSQVGADQAVDHAGHLVAGERRADDAADGGTADGWRVPVGSSPTSGA